MSFKDFQNLDAEVREFIANAKSKKTTYYEPCNSRNVKECLISLSEELNFLNINYNFNPYTDIDETFNLDAGSLVKLVNASWCLLQHYKKTADVNIKSQERMHNLEVNNKFLNKTINNLKEELKKTQSELDDCLRESRRIADKAMERINETNQLKATMKRIEQQKLSNERRLSAECKRNEKRVCELEKELSTKCGTYSVKTKSNTFRNKELAYLDSINKLMTDNDSLVREICDLRRLVIDHDE